MFPVVFIFLCITFPQVFAHGSSVESADHEVVTCGSQIKLEHLLTRTRLHSHSVTYGTGSGQQSVTGMHTGSDPNSFWIVRGQSGTTCVQGTPIKIGDVIRLQHHSTRCHLHSHLHKAPLSGNLQEVSCFPDDNNDDNWIVVSQGEANWKRGEPVSFKHQSTGKFLIATDKKFGNPIPGQSEIASSSSSNRGLFKTAEGFYFPKK